MQPAKLSLWEKVVPDLAFDGLGWHGTCPACHTNALELRVYSESEFDVLCHTPRCSGPAAIQAARVLLAGVGRTAAESPTPNAQRPNAQCPTPDAPGFPFLSIEQVLALPLPRYQVHGLIYEQSLVQFFGEPGHGKSFLCLDLGLSFAAGAPGWFGHRIERPGPVAWINADGGRGFIRRLGAWRQAHPAPLAHPFLTLMGEVRLNDPPQVHHLIDHLSTWATPPALLVFDTLSRCISGTDENSAAEMTRVMQSCHLLRRELACSVILIHHTNKGGLADRGCSVVKAEVDMQVRVHKVPGDRTGTVTAEKVREDDLFPAFNFCIQPLGDSAVVTTAGGLHPALHPAGTNGKAYAYA